MGKDFGGKQTGVKSRSCPELVPTLNQAVTFKIP